jgi:hypothetical protein
LLGGIDLANGSSTARTNAEYADQARVEKQASDSIKSYAAGLRKSEELQLLDQWDEACPKYVQARAKWFEPYEAGWVQEAADYRAKNTNVCGAATVDILGRIISMQRGISDQRQVAAETSERSIRLIVLILHASALLAMNAAIEAAHAGEFGKGFAVVDSPSESERSFDLVAAKMAETGDLVKEISSAMVGQRSGSSQVLEALKAMNDIAAHVRKRGPPYFPPIRKGYRGNNH